MTSAEQLAIRRLLEPLTNTVIVECGAYTGDDGPMLDSLASGPTLHVMVEPDPGNFRKILDRPESYKWRMIHGAIAAKVELRRFHFSNDPCCERASGSLLEATGHLKHFPHITFHHSALIECFTLDEIFRREALEKIDLLWVDIQGAEREMIAGGKHALARTRYCFMEAEEVEMYAGQALKPELIALMEGWELIEDFGFNILLRNMRFNEW